MRADLATGRPSATATHFISRPRNTRSLVFFLRHPGQVLSRTRIYEHVWDERYDGFSNTLEVHVKELRRKLEALAPARFTPCGAAVTCWATHPRRRRRSQNEPGGAGVRFFLATLALVLGGISVTLYLLSSATCTGTSTSGWVWRSTRWRHRSTWTRGWWNGIRRTTVALRWFNRTRNRCYWMVTDHEGTMVDRTWEVGAGDFAAVAKLAPNTGHSHETHTDGRGRRWRAACGGARRAGCR